MQVESSRCGICSSSGPTVTPLDSLDCIYSRADNTILVRICTCSTRHAVWPLQACLLSSKSHGKESVKLAVRAREGSNSKSSGKGCSYAASAIPSAGMQRQVVTAFDLAGYAALHDCLGLGAASNRLGGSWHVRPPDFRSLEALCSCSQGTFFLAVFADMPIGGVSPYI